MSLTNFKFYLLGVIFLLLGVFMVFKLDSVNSLSYKNQRCMFDKP